MIQMSYLPCPVQPKEGWATQRPPPQPLQQSYFMTLPHPPSSARPDRPSAHASGFSVPDLPDGTLHDVK